MFYRQRQAQHRPEAAAHQAFSVEPTRPGDAAQVTKLHPHGPGRFLHRSRKERASEMTRGWDTLRTRRASRGRVNRMKEGSCRRLRGRERGARCTRGHQAQCQAVSTPGLLPQTRPVGEHSKGNEYDQGTPDSIFFKTQDLKSPEGSVNKLER